LRLVRQGIGIHEQTLEIEFPAGPNRGCNSEKVSHWQIVFREIETSIRNMKPWFLTGKFLQHIWEVGGGAELNREIVSCRARVRPVCMSSEFGAKTCGLRLSLFPFSPREVFPFPWREKKKERERERGERERERERERDCVI